MSPAYHSNGAPLLRPCWAYAPTRCIPPARVPAISPPSRAVLRLPPSAAATCAPTTASAMASRSRLRSCPRVLPSALSPRATRALTARRRRSTHAVPLTREARERLLPAAEGVGAFRRPRHAHPAARISRGIEGRSPVDATDPATATGVAGQLFLHLVTKGPKRAKKVQRLPSLMFFTSPTFHVHRKP